MTALILSIGDASADRFVSASSCCRVVVCVSRTFTSLSSAGATAVAVKLEPAELDLGLLGPDPPDPLPELEDDFVAGGAGCPDSNAAKRPRISPIDSTPRSSI